MVATAEVAGRLVHVEGGLLLERRLRPHRHRLHCAIGPLQPVEADHPVGQDPHERHEEHQQQHPHGVTLGIVGHVPLPWSDALSGPHVMGPPGSGL